MLYFTKSKKFFVFHKKYRATRLRFEVVWISSTGVSTVSPVFRCARVREEEEEEEGGCRAPRWVRFRSLHFGVSLTRFSSSWRDASLTPVPFRPRDARDDDDGDGWKMEKLSASITGLSWSSVSLPLDVIVSKFRLPTLVRLSHGKKDLLLNVVINWQDQAHNQRSCAPSARVCLTLLRRIASKTLRLLPNQS